jgi:antitoxin component YwqK of YwqJK toxin-antitoxin module
MNLILRKTSSFIFFSLLLLSCSNSNPLKTDLRNFPADCYCKDLEYDSDLADSLIRHVDTKEVFTGTCEKKDDDGFRHELIQYKSGQLHGLLVSWDETGVLRRKLSFFNGKQQGVQLVWNDKGELVVNAYFEKGKYINDLSTD